MNRYENLIILQSLLSQHEETSKMIQSSLQYPGTCPIVEEIEDGDSEPSKLSSIQPVPSNEGGGIKLVSYNRRRSLAPALKLMNAAGGHRRGSVIALPRFQESNLIVCHYTNLPKHDKCQTHSAKVFFHKKLANF